MDCPAPPVADADRLASFHHYLFGHGVRDDGDIGPLHRGSKIGLGGAAPCAVAHRHIHPAKTFLLLPVDIRCHRIACLRSRIYPRLIERVSHRAVPRIERSVAAAIAVATLIAPFGPFEIG